jgi:hypothetical protein
MKLVFCLTAFIIGVTAFGQIEKGQTFRFYSVNAMFPDTFRNVHPRVYEGKTFSGAAHYSDSSTYIFVPDYFDKKKPFVFVFYFHGWGNNIDTALIQFQLKEQFYNAHINAVFVFPEGPQNAPDSYAGKWEQSIVFNNFMKELEPFLVERKVIDAKPVKPSMIIAGHSGAYRVMSYILLHSNYNCKSIILFDALYGEIEKFAMYLQMHPLTKFINIYTNEGGTMQNSKDLETCFKAWQWKFIAKEENDFSVADIQQARIIFLHSQVGHSAVITNNQNFQRFLIALNVE